MDVGVGVLRSDDHVVMLLLLVPVHPSRPAETGQSAVHSAGICKDYAETSDSADGGIAVCVMRKREDIEAAAGERRDIIEVM